MDRIPQEASIDKPTQYEGAPIVSARQHSPHPAEIAGSSKAGRRFGRPAINLHRGQDASVGWAVPTIDPGTMYESVVHGGHSPPYKSKTQLFRPDAIEIGTHLSSGDYYEDSI